MHLSSPHLLGHLLPLGLLITLLFSPPPANAALPIITANDMIQVGNTLYVAAQGSPERLRVYDVTNSASPEAEGFISLVAEAQQLTVYGNTLYADTGGEIIIVDITTPVSPTVIPWGLHSSRSVAAQNGILVSVRDAGTLDVFGLANPHAPTLLASNLAPSGTDPEWNYLLEAIRPYLGAQFLIQWEYWSETGSSYGSASLIDTTDPANVNFFPGLGSFLLWDGWQCGFSSSGWHDTPSVISGTHESSGSCGAGWTAFRSRAWGANPTGLVALDDDPASNGHSVLTWSSTAAFWSVVHHGNSGIYPVNVADPANPVLGTFYPTTESYDRLFRVGDHVYTEHLDVIDVANLAVTAPLASSASSVAFSAAPNPFRASGGVSLSFAATAAGHHQVSIYDVSGRHVATVFDGHLAVGPNRVSWSNSDAAVPLAAGVYFARLEGPDVRETTRLVLLD